jgi:hypothetical protein
VGAVVEAPIELTHVLVGSQGGSQDCRGKSDAGQQVAQANSDNANNFA